MAGLNMRPSNRVGSGKIAPKGVNRKNYRTITNYERGGKRVVRRTIYDH